MSEKTERLQRELLRQFFYAEKDGNNSRERVHEKKIGSLY